MSKAKGKSAGQAAAVQEETGEVVAGSEDQPTEAPVEQAAPEHDYRGEAERLRQENADLKAQNTRQTETRQQSTNNVITSAGLKNLGPKEWEALEEQTGLSKDTIMARVESNELRQENAHIKAKQNVAEALEDAAEKDPQVHRLKPFIREYLNDISIEDRSDSEKLARHMAKAKVYAKGRLAEKGGYRAPAAEGEKVKSRGPEDTSDNDEGDDEEIKAGQEVNVDGLRFKVSHLGNKAAKRAADIKHPRDPNGIMFRGAGEKAFDKPPIFRRGE